MEGLAGYIKDGYAFLLQDKEQLSKYNSQNCGNENDEKREKSEEDLEKEIKSLRKTVQEVERRLYRDRERQRRGVGTVILKQRCSDIEIYRESCW